MNPTTLNEIRDALLLWANDITGREVLLANSGDGEAPRPRNPYVEIFIEMFSNPATQVVTHSEDGLLETIKSNTLLTVTLDVYGNNPMQDTSKLMRSLYSARRYQDLWTICGLGGINEATDLTALERAALKQRAQISFTLYCILFDVFVSDFFTTVEIEVDVLDREVIDVIGGEDPREKAAICPL